MAGGKKHAIKELKNGLENFREDALKKGWEQDEVDEKIKEVFENFPWYKYNPKKRSWKSSIFNFCLFAFIMYLVYGAVMQKNRRWKKKVDDYIFDCQISYHTHRVMRIMSLPLFKIFDLSKFHDRDCIINNPFKTKEAVDCQFCNGINNITFTKVDDPEVQEMINAEEPFLLEDVKDYHDANIGFKDLKEMFDKNPTELDDAVCRIKKSDQFKTISEFFSKVPDVKTMNDQGLSIEWSNCDTYGTRFYRKIFKRPSFIAKESEINFEKTIFMLQKGQNSSIETTEGKSFYLYQAQGSSMFEMSATSECHYNCTENPITIDVNPGNIVVFPTGGWSTSFKALGEGLNVFFLSSFT